MKCLACKNDTIVDSKTTYFAHLPNCYLIIENVPCKKGNFIAVDVEVLKDE